MSRSLVAPSDRRGFLGKAGAALAAAVAVVTPAHAVLTPTGLTSRQREVLKFFAELDDEVQTTVIAILKDYASEPMLRRDGGNGLVVGAA